MSQDLQDYYYLVGRNRGAGLPNAEAEADDALQPEEKGPTMVNREVRAE